jgi:hypothetical protein
MRREGAKSAKEDAKKKFGIGRLLLFSRITPPKQRWVSGIVYLGGRLFERHAAIMPIESEPGVLG